EEVSIQGVAYFQASEKSGMHLHIHQSRLHIAAFEKGHGTVTLNGVDYRIQPGDIFVIFPGDRHQFLPDARHPFVALFWHLLWYGSIPVDLPRYLNLPKQERPAFFRLNLRAVKTWNATETPANQMMLHGYLLQVFANLLRVSHASDTPKPELGFADVDKTLNPVLNALHGPPFFYPGIDALAEKAGVSRRTLTKMFRQYAGCGIKQYYFQNMMRYVDRVLSTGEEHMCDVAKFCGYSSTQNFLHARRDYLARPTQKTNQREPVASPSPTQEETPNR
ncbi:MAG: helix-turn-helix domain-containing protein, partial [Victivallales bacterium]|nr:helix-turn-helix domain-containing protein [Victivallales bacterium]